MPRQRPTDAPQVVHRTARIALRTTPAQRQRCFGLLRSGGDVWACVLELNAIRRRRKGEPLVTYQALCREFSADGPGIFGELSTTGARSILRRYSDSWMTTARRRRGGEMSARYPRRKKALVPSRYYAGTFSLDERRLTIPVTRGSAPLVVRLTREVPYPATAIRSVTLLADGARLCVDVTAEVEVERYTPEEAPDPTRIAGVDLGMIHLFAVVADEGSLLVSGRALRAESRLHLVESKARHRAVARRAPSKGQRGSRRWRKYRARTKVLEGRHSRRLAQARHEAARSVVDFAREKRIGALVVGDPRGVLDRDVGARQNLATRNWRVGRMIGVLQDKATAAGIEVTAVDERGTSSTCPRCEHRVPKPKGRNFSCPHCHLQAHRDMVGAINIASKSPRDGINVDPARLAIMHRRAGRHLPGRTRRDPRRVAWQKRGQLVGQWPAAARPGDVHDDDPGESLAKDASAP
ncbi:MAG TPA: transposase [Acidimicrobiales bacterium]